MNKIAFSAILLTGGQSIRMGQEKAQLNLKGHPLWGHIALQLAPVCSHILVSQGAGQSLQKNTLLLSQFKKGQLSFHQDLKPHLGPLYALSLSAPLITTQWTWVLSCDLPFVTTAFLRTMACHRAPNQMVVTNNGALNPLFALYPTKVLKQAGNLWSTGRQDAKALLEQTNLHPLINHPEARGINNPAAYQAALKELKLA